MTQMTTNMPAIIWGLESPIGVSIVRELGRLGVYVIGLSNEEDAIGLRSKYLAEGIMAKPRGPELLKQICAIGERLGPCLLLAVSEGPIKFLAENRHSLGNVTPIVPPLDVLNRALDKAKTLSFSASLGISIPNTIEIQSGKIDSQALNNLQYPVVLKWQDTVSIYPLLNQHHIPFIKTEYAESRTELDAILQRYNPVGLWPLIQEYCPGYGLGQFFFMHEGKALRRFQHRRICEWPPEGGGSCVCEAIPLEDHWALQQQSIALLQAIGWEGVAMVEYRYDPVKQRAVLMEINGRFWGSFPLAVHCGAGFAHYAYAVQGMGKPVELPAPRAGLRVRMVWVEAKRLFLILFQAHKIQDKQFIRKPGAEIVRFILDFVNPKTRYCLFTMDDPGPFIADIKNMIATLTRLIFRPR